MSLVVAPGTGEAAVVPQYGEAQLVLQAMMTQMDVQETLNEAKEVEAEANKKAHEAVSDRVALLGTQLATVMARLEALETRRTEENTHHTTEIALLNKKLAASDATNKKQDQLIQTQSTALAALKTEIARVRTYAESTQSEINCKWG